MKATIAIPTYWGRKDGEGRVEEDRLFDHPTALDGPETLGPCLESLKRLRPGDWDVCIVLACTSPDLVASARERVRALVAAVAPTYPCFVLDDEGMALLAKRALSHRGSEDILALDGYGNVRNACLLAALLLNADAAVLVDDDEVVEDEAFLERAIEGLSVRVDERRAAGVAGFYKGADDAWRLGPETAPWQRHWPKSLAMNAAFARLVEAPARYTLSFLALGGNMVVSRPLLERVPFDPWIHRGEDIDYVFNAALFGYAFVFDKELWIRHLPPPRGHSAAVALAEDACRFLRARAKLRALSATENEDLQPVTLEDLQPYPGRFLGDGLEGEADAAFGALLGEIGDDETLAAEAKRMRQRVVEAAAVPAQPLQAYRRVQRTWCAMTRSLACDPVARRALAPVSSSTRED